LGRREEKLIRTLTLEVAKEAYLSGSAMDGVGSKITGELDVGTGADAGTGRTSSVVRERERDRERGGGQKVERRGKKDKTSKRASGPWVCACAGGLCEQLG
jgi:hypothetical protein